MDAAVVGLSQALARQAAMSRVLRQRRRPGLVNVETPSFAASRGMPTGKVPPVGYGGMYGPPAPFEASRGRKPVARLPGRPYVGLRA